MPLPEDKQITLQEAAETLAISPSRLRRWADEGRVPSVRTAGGHRRFSLAAVRRLADESGVRTKVRPVEPPAAPLPLLAECLGPHGRQLTVAAAAAIYREGPPGWFASEAGAAALREWVQALRESSESGAYGSALQATTTLMQRAQAPVLEQDAFLERFGQICARTLVRMGAEREEIVGARRLFASLAGAPSARTSPWPAPRSSPGSEPPRAPRRRRARPPTPTSCGRGDAPGPAR